jgi:hypothetical protein
LALPAMARSESPIDQLEIVAGSAEVFTLEHGAGPDQGATGAVARAALGC